MATFFEYLKRKYTQSATPTEDAGWKEEDHPRNEKGGTGGGRFRTSEKRIDEQDFHDSEEDVSDAEVREMYETVANGDELKSIPRLWDVWWPKESEGNGRLDNYWKGRFIFHLGKPFGDWRDGMIHDSIRRYGPSVVESALPGRNDTEYSRAFYNRGGGYVMNTANGMRPLSWMAPSYTPEEVRDHFEKDCKGTKERFERMEAQFKKEMDDFKSAKLSIGDKVKTRYGEGKIVGFDKDSTSVFVKWGDGTGGDWVAFSDLKKA